MTAPFYIRSHTSTSSNLKNGISYRLIILQSSSLLIVMEIGHMIIIYNTFFEKVNKKKKSLNQFIQTKEIKNLCLPAWIADYFHEISFVKIKNTFLVSILIGNL